MSVILIALLTAALYYLGSRAMITRALWSHYPAPIARFMDCPACSGFWYGAWCTYVLSYYDPHLSYLGLEVGSPFTWIAVGLCSIVATPIVAGLMQRSLDVLGTAVPPAEEEPQREYTRLV